MAKIALINQRYGLEVNGGSEYYTRLIAERLAKKHQVEVLTSCALGTTGWPNHYELGLQDVNGIAVRRFPTTRSHSLGYPTHSEKWVDDVGPFVPDLISYIREYKDEYDVFIPITYLYYPTVRAAPLVAEKSIVIPTAHNESFIYYPVYRRVFGADPAFPKPAFLLFLTEEERDFIHGLFHNDGIPCDVAGVGVDLPGRVDSDAFRQKFHITTDYCLYTGRIEAHGKGCNALLQYFTQYKKRNSNDLKLVLMGKSSMKIPKHKDIIHVGFVSEEDKFNGLAGAKALCLHSMFESLSISALEALALGVPILVNEHCAVLKGHCEKSDAGLYYKGYFEFEGALNYLLTHDREYGIMSENAKRYIQQYYRWDIIMEKFEKAIGFILRQNQGSMAT